MKPINLSQFDNIPAGRWHVGTNGGRLEDEPAFPGVHDDSGLPHGGDIVLVTLGNSETCKANAALAVLCRNSLPDLIAELKACREALQAIANFPDEGTANLHELDARVFSVARALLPETKANP